VPIIRHNGLEMTGEANLGAADCAVGTDHSCYDWAAIQQRVGLIVDARHVIVPV
jgi:hypothetical protein